MKDTIWIAWERHRRTIEICKTLNIELIILDSKLCRIFKHPYFTILTIIRLIKYKPKVLFVQNPSILLTFIACVLKSMLKYTLIVDTHNAALDPENRLLKLIRKINFFLHSRSDLTIITNNSLAKFIYNNSQYFVLPDKVPDVDLNNRKIALKGAINVVCVCTYGDDEPYSEMFEAANTFGADVFFYFTGSVKKLSSKKVINDYTTTSNNIILTGFLPDQDYWSLLKSSDLIIDLTNREACLVCGAYEAVASEVPLILSDTKALRELFVSGAVFTQNSADKISESIISAINNLRHLKNEIILQKQLMNNNWNVLSSELIDEIDKIKGIRD
ncbi:glycosyltransferase [Oryzomonas japonica]|nr:glycosyltransferase [Oryzomonas japonica]